MALKSFKRVFDSNKCYLVLTTEDGDNNYTEIKILTEKNEIAQSKLEDGKINKALRNSLKASDSDLIYDLSDIDGCNNRKKGFRFKDLVDANNAGKEVYLNASNTIIYGNVEVLGIDVKALYISTDKRLVGKGEADSAKIKNESIQSALEFANIDGLKGELGCDINGVKNYNFYYLNIENKVNKGDVEEAKTVYEAADAEIEKATTPDSKTTATAARNKALKKYSNMAQAYLRAVEEKKLSDELEDANKFADEAQKKMDEEKIKKEDNFLESLGIRFKQASVIHYEAQDVDKDLNGVLHELKQKIEGNSELLA